MKKIMIRDDVLSYREMCDKEGAQALQRGMNYRLNSNYSVILMSQRRNAPYRDRIHPDGLTIEYEGHDTPRSSYDHNPKTEDQPSELTSGRLTQNGLFIKAINDFKSGKSEVEIVKVYEKILPGVWSLKGLFRLIDYKLVDGGNRKVFRFILRLDPTQKMNQEPKNIKLEQTRVIPTSVKQVVWARDGGRCVICQSTENLHFDHDLPFSKGGTSLTPKNVRLLCMKHNLQKSAKIE